MTCAPVELLDNRCDPDARAVLEDYELSQGWRPSRPARALWFMTAAYDAAASASDAAADADADAAADAAADADAAAADADADAAAARARLFQLLIEEPDMREGLKILSLPGSYGYYRTTIVGWVQRVSGDEYRLLPGARTIIRTADVRTLAELASAGPGEGHRLTSPSTTDEDLMRWTILRSLHANEKAWEKDCPRPKEWRETP